MKHITPIILIIFSLISDAQERKQPSKRAPEKIYKKSEIEKVCRDTISKTQHDQKMKDEFCKCWVKNADKLTGRARRLIVQEFAGIISTRRLEEMSDPLAEFAFDLENNCFRDSQWNWVKSY